MFIYNEYDSIKDGENCTSGVIKDYLGKAKRYILAQALPLYAMNVFLLSHGLCKDLEKMFFFFFFDKLYT